MIRFTGKIYECPKCGREMDGYIEDEEEEAGCIHCLNFWKVSELKIITNKERIIFT